MLLLSYRINLEKKLILFDFYRYKIIKLRKYLFINSFN